MSTPNVTASITSATFVMLAVTFGVGMALLAGLERLTDGWGIEGRFFAPAVFASLPVWQLAIIYTLALALLMFVGAAGGATFVRWGSTGLIVFFGSIAALAIALSFVITWGGWWQSLGDFLAGRTALELAVMTLPIMVVAAAGGFALLRRAAPRG